MTLTTKNILPPSSLLSAFTPTRGGGGVGWVVSQGSLTLLRILTPDIYLIPPSQRKSRWAVRYSLLHQVLYYKYLVSITSLSHSLLAAVCSHPYLLRPSNSPLSLLFSVSFVLHPLSIHPCKPQELPQLPPASRICTSRETQNRSTKHILGVLRNTVYICKVL